MAEYPRKSRVAFLEVGDIFSFAESGCPSMIILKKNSTSFFYVYINGGAGMASVHKYSQRIILILGHREVYANNIRYRYINTENGEKYKNIDEIAKALGLTKSTVSRRLNRKINKKIPIEKIRSY